ncbi:hypothetical protein V5O48_012513 [Marasmius crinis-equi]|uniref:Uncharacterized protein n=1 Tax=Marasmius crinis-equi TaxID=585013 RepID=A0ABR3F2N6_9AGAR
MHDLTENDLTRNVLPAGFKNTISYEDGLVGAIMHRTREFITSPNCYAIPQPPHGSTRDLYRRADGFYADDDPVQWPQPFNNAYIYLACVPKFPISDQDPYDPYRRMWGSMTERDMDINIEDRARREGVVNNRFAAEFQQAVDYLHRRTKPYLDSPESSVNGLLSEFHNNITICLRRATSVSMSFRDLRRAVAELQRNWLCSVALLDYVEVFRKSMTRSSSDDSGVVENRMGAFVWNDQDALKLFQARLPVYYVRPYNAFGRQVILSVKPLENPRLCTAAASPPYLTALILCQAGSDDKFAAIRSESISCFNVSSPFANMHLAGAYTSSHSIVGSSSRIISPSQSHPSMASTSNIGPIRALSSAVGETRHTPYDKSVPRRSRGKKGRQNPPQPQLSRFSDLPADLPHLPPLICAFRGVNASIDVHHPLVQSRPGEKKLSLIVPDPVLVFGSSKPDRQRANLVQWAHFREAWIARCRDNTTVTEPIASGVWKNVLALSSIGLWDNEKTAATSLQQEHVAASELVSDTFWRYAPGRPLTSSPASPAPPTDDARRLVQELSWINFRYQLEALDKLADTTTPKPSPSLTAAELQVRMVRHHTDRSNLIQTVFGEEGDIFTVSDGPSIRGFVAENWRVRSSALRAFWKLMDSWPGEKDRVWGRGADENLEHLVGAGTQWENVLMRFYAQTYFNFFGFPPVLPRLR